MDKLPAEVFNELLDHLEPKGREGHLSSSRHNPWALPQPYRPDHIDSRHHYSRLRLVCKRFSELAAPYLFRNIGLRFNAKSFARLEKLAREEKLAQHVRKVVLLMPYLYEQGIQDFDAFRNDQTLGLSNKIRHIMFEEQEPYYYPTVLKEQQEILNGSYDLKVLTAAFRSFKSLQEINLLAIMVHKDIVLRNLASSFDTWEFTDCKWIPACKHAVETLTQAMYDAGSTVTAFCSPTMSPQSLILTPPKHRNMARQSWSNLTYLEVTFDERPDRSYLDTSGTILTEHNNLVASMFRDFLHVATNLSVLYVRFTPGMPVRLPLADAFGKWVWPKLRVLGIGSWMVQSHELIDVFRRHGRTLRGLRLNEIYLFDDGPQRWRDVVSAIKEHATSLEWVGLTDISYEREYVRKQAYIETYSDTSSEAEDEYIYDMDRLSIRSRDSISSTTISHHTQNNGGAGGDDGDDEDEDVVYGNVFTTTPSNGGPSSVAGSSVHAQISRNVFSPGFLDSPSDSELESLGDGPVRIPEDDGRTVTQAQRRHWERWIMGRYSSGRPYPHPL